MSIRFVLGAAGTGKTWHCLAALRQLEREGRRGIYLVPEQFTYSADRELLGGGGLSGLRHVQVLSFSRLGYRLREEAGAPMPPVLPESVRPMVLRAVMMRMEPERLGPLLALRDRQGLLVELGRFVAEVRAHGAPEFLMTVERSFAAEDGPVVRNAAARRLRALAAVFAEYDRTLRDLGRIDPEANLAGLEALIAGARAEVGTWAIFVDGFLSWTRREREILVALAVAGARLQVALCLERAEAAPGPGDRFPFVPVRRSYEQLRGAFERASVPVEPPLVLSAGAGAPGRFAADALARLERKVYGLPVEETVSPAEPAVTLRPARSPRAEVQLWARQLDAWLRLDPAPVRPEEVAVIVRDLAPYRDFVREIFPRYQLPVFVDERRGLLAHPRVRLLLDALEVLLSGWRRDAVIAYLRNPLHAEAPAGIDLVEFLSLEYGRDFDAWHEDRWESYLLPSRARFARADSERPGASGDEGDEGEDEAPDGEENGLEEEDLPAGLAGNVAADASGTPAAVSGAGEGGDAPDGEDAAARLRARLFAVGDALRARRLLPLRRMEEAWEREEADGPRMASDLRTFLAEAVAAETDAAGAEAPRPASALDADPEWDRLAERELETVLHEAASLWAGLPVELEEFARTLRQGLASARVGVTPLRLGQVVVAEIQRSRLHGIRRAIVGGLNDGQFPRVVSEDPILPDRDRTLLAAAGVELGPAAAARQEEETYLGYIALTRASERIVLTWSRMDEQGASLGPSPLLDEVRRTLSDLPVDEEPWVEAESAPVETVQKDHELALQMVSGLARGEDDPLLAALWQRRESVPLIPRIVEEARPALEFSPEPALAPEVMERVYPGGVIACGVSRLREFADCPYLGFARRLLALKPRPLAAVTPLETGTLAHAALDRFFREAAPEDTAAIAGRLRQVFRQLEHLDEYRAFRVDEASLYRWESTRRNLERFLRVEAHRVLHGAYAPAARETAFGPLWGNALELPLPEGGRLVLVGRIDRLDLGEAGPDRPRAVVIDYKRSEQKGLPRTLREGLDLQLAAYLLVVRDVLGYEPAGGLYLPVLIAPLPAEKLDDNPVNPLGVRGHGLVLREEVQRIDGGSGLVPGLGPRKSQQVIESSGELDELLEVGRGYLAGYADGMRRGVIRPEPLDARGRDLPCERCDYGPLCRFRPGRDPVRRTPLERLAPPAEEALEATGEEGGGR